MRTFYWRGKSRPPGLTPRRSRSVTVSLDAYMQLSAIADRLGTTMQGALDSLLGDLPEVRT
jgi:hypothetical protein